jgi:hypothetical protein
MQIALIAILDSITQTAPTPFVTPKQPINGRVSNQNRFLIGIPRGLRGYDPVQEARRKDMQRELVNS